MPPLKLRRHADGVSIKRPVYLPLATSYPMKQVKLENISDKFFLMAWELYEGAFPLKERRLKDAQARVMKKRNYNFDIVINNDQFIGFILWWDFETLRYVEHFATSTLQRNKGFGKLILEKFIKSNDKPILLEVELPHSSINQRRIEFYERTGFKLNQHYYELPSMHEGQSPLQLLLMTYPNLLSAEDVERFIKICHPIIFED